MPLKSVLNVYSKLERTYDSIKLPTDPEPLKTKCENIREEAKNSLKEREPYWKNEHIGILDQLVRDKYNNIVKANIMKTKEQKEEVLKKYKKHILTDVLLRYKRSASNNSEGCKEKQDSHFDEKYDRLKCLPLELELLQPSHWEEVKDTLHDNIVSI